MVTPPQSPQRRRQIQSASHGEDAAGEGFPHRFQQLRITSGRPPSESARPGLGAGGAYCRGGIIGVSAGWTVFDGAPEALSDPSRAK
jgi:hypothetical protein